MRPILNGSKEAIQIDMSTHLSNSIANTMAIQSDLLFKDLLTGDGFGTRNPPKPTVHRRIIAARTRSRIISYDNGYWVKITIESNDHVRYKLFNGGWLAKSLHKIGFRKIIDSGWDSVKQRDTIEATLGATYMAIDEAIAEDMKKSKHSTFLKEMIKTDPDNLKAIAQLDMLDKGDGPGSENDAPTAMPPSATSIQYSNNMVVSGSGAYLMKEDESEPASLTVGPDNSMMFGNLDTLGSPAEEVVRVDPEGNVSHGDAIADAIKLAAEEKGELHGS